MIVNGVTLPDIPDEVLAQFPYAVITANYIPKYDATAYSLNVSEQPFDHLSQTFVGQEALLTHGAGQVLVASASDSAWDATGSSPQSPLIVMLGSTTGATGNAIEVSMAWTNHEIKEILWIDFDNMEWGTEPKEPKPTRVSIGRSLVDGYAREVQRLTGTTEQMNAIQIREKLSTVKAAIKIGDTVLPPIPEDVLAEYPYAMIGLNSDYNMYLLGVSDTPFAYLPAELTTTGKAFITTVGFRHKFYAYDGSAWVFQNENSTERIYQELNETIGVCWANDDICTITSRTDAQGEITVGTEVYFSERQNFNGVWLPKIPTEAQGYSNFVVIRAILLGTENYMLLGCAGGSLVVKDSSPLDPSMPDVYPNWLYLSKPVVIYDGIVDGEWVYDSEASGTGYQMLPMPMVTAELDGEFMSTDIFWSDHDIMEAVINSTEVPVGTDNLYFPPLPAIDSDRVSIGYDLCNGIVEEVQRLSGDQEKMNALRAYWKLTTVSAVAVSASGEIIIDGVKLPPFPEVDYPYAFIYVQDLSQYGEIVYYLQFSAEKYFYHYLNSNDGYAYAPSDYSAGTIQYRLYKSKIAEGQIWYGEEPTEAFYKDYGNSGIKWSNYDIRKDDPDTGEIVVKRTV